ncbi:hypothetical protein GF314_05195 [bacterium]|nr:hypothetical protein [bacterium]
MQTYLALLLTAAMIIAPAAASDLSHRPPTKPPATHAPPPPADPDVVRQGGDTIQDAVPLPIPTIDLTGTTIGYNDDYAEQCPYWPDGPDVVYSIVPDVDQELDIDLCGSHYDTKVFVYDEDLQLIACNDDFYTGPPCGVYVSKIERMPVQAGAEYFVVVDCYSEPGNYLLDIVPHVPCVLDCPDGAALEGEPPLAIDYVDHHNGGCNTDLDDPPLQPITTEMFCGVSGWYLNQGEYWRDTDWFTLEIPAGGVLEIVGDAEQPCYMFELGPQDCGGVDVVQSVVIGPCLENPLTIAGAPGDVVWFWVGPDTFTAPDGQDVYEFGYVLHTNLGPVAVENRSWTAVKTLFR